ncbi:SCP-2 sterol transfer family protein [Ferrithrix thermotolerans DSM 19514]|jgi:putative sterol carrier protein|uniref:SCP-2 sterol transfer family protein n=1 Tax=Ferrithrix thermotolerans DSM 19514 TaxID=1121881 RepID=A0A1M4S711_9ACTN|nr:SCP2 sterol-binding domain-containing protein [Ferrithrix thermotolerans]SHE27971.1 SCP-2 sterol transfer family protein [Ferrithrix thermotolerans DSM 19514]
MGRWLSQQWIEDTKRLGMDMPKQEGMSAAIQYTISNTPSGDVSYAWIVKDGQLIDAYLGECKEPDVTLTIAMSDARSMAKGELDATAAFMQGLIGVEGDMNKLISLLPLTTSKEYQDLEKQLATLTDFEL